MIKSGRCTYARVNDSNRTDYIRYKNERRINKKDNNPIDLFMKLYLYIISPPQQNYAKKTNISYYFSILNNVC